jgi:hypothetical protein
MAAEERGEGRGGEGPFSLESNSVVGGARGEGKEEEIGGGEGQSVGGETLMIGGGLRVNGVTFNTVDP